MEASDPPFLQMAGYRWESLSCLLSHISSWTSVEKQAAEWWEVWKGGRAARYRAKNAAAFLGRSLLCLLWEPQKEQCDGGIEIGRDFWVSGNLSEQSSVSQHVPHPPSYRGKKSYLLWKFWNLRLLAVYRMFRKQQVGPLWGQF